MYENICCNCLKDTGGQDPCIECGKTPFFKNDPSALQPRTILNGQYFVGKSLGSGGFGITYLSLDLNLKMRVAIKEFLPKSIAGRSRNRMTVQANTDEYADHYELGLSKFLEEARTLAKFRHPSIISVSAFFKENNTAYFVMPYIPGKTLEEYVTEQQGISEQELLRIISPVLEGLEKIHESHILHRDIKPANIYVPNEGIPLLLDFGAARQSMMDDNQALSVFLTYGYAPFEQYQSTGRQGPYTDIYACAATMYSCLRGKIESGRIVPPTPAPDRHNGEMLPHIKNESRQRISDDLANAIMKGLELDATRRPQSVSEFHEMIAIKPPPPVARTFELLATEGEFKGNRIPLSSRPVIMGRSAEECDVILSDDTISSTHCQIHVAEGVVYVRDMEATNGIRINHEEDFLEPQQTRQVQDGDIISLADSQFFQIVGIGAEQTEQTIRFKPDFAGFWKRFAALLTDGLVSLLFFILAFGTFKMIQTEDNQIEAIAAGSFVLVVMHWLYFTVMESASGQGTLGKLACGIIVTELDGTRISFRTANERFFSKIISVLILGLGFIMAGFTVKKQTLHDKVAECLVINRQSGDYAGFWKRFAAWLVDHLVFIIFFVSVSFIYYDYDKLWQLAENIILTASESIAPVSLESYLNAVGDRWAGFAPDALLISLFVLGIPQWLYFAFMEGSGSRATLGKMALGIAVTDLAGNPISFGRATGRYFGKLISLAILLIGFIMAGFTVKKRGLHDMMAGCVVINKT